MKLAKNQANAKKNPEVELLHYPHSWFTLLSKNNGTYSKKLKIKCVCIHEIIYVIIVKMMMKMKNRSYRHNINSLRSRHIVNIRIVSPWWCLYVCIREHLSIWSSVHEKLSNTEAELKKGLVIKKAFISLVPLITPPPPPSSPLAVGVKAYLIYFLFRRGFEVVLAWIVKKSVFPFQISWILKLWFEDFYKRVLFICSACVRLSKENLFCSNNVPEIHIFNFWRHQKLLLVANQLQDSNFFKKINSKDIGISKFVSQLELLPSLFELKDNDTFIISTIIKKLQDMSRSEVGEVVRLLLLSQATNAVSDGA